jgi:hypothetical protein
MSREFELITTKVDEEADYPKHVRAKIAAYKKAGLKYLIGKDPLMKRSILFEAKRRMRPDTHQIKIQTISRLKDEAQGQEYIIYDTYERILDDANRKVEDNISYGIEDYIEADPVIDSITGALKDKTKTVHENRYTIPYTPAEVRKILAKQHRKNNIPLMYVGVTSPDANKRWAGDSVRVRNLESFINVEYNDLMLMSMTHSNTVEEAMASANTIREDRSMSNIMNKEKILSIAREVGERINPHKKESSK